MPSFKALLALFLCCLLSAPAPMGYAAPAAATARPAYRSTQLQGDQRILHALNRFTFGPRPGDLEAVRAEGLDAWFQQQLHPGTLDQTDLNARLAQFPAMQLSVQDLMLRYPSNVLIRQALNGRIRVPDQGIEHAIYANQMSRVQARQLNKDKNQARPEPPAAPNMAMDANPMAQPEPGNAMMSADNQANTQADTAADPSQIEATLALPPAQRIDRLANLQQPELDAFIRSLKPIQRARLNADLTPQQREIVAALQNPERMVGEELISQRLIHDIYSSAQLQEVMTDFWLNHFNIYLHKNEQMPYYLVSYERDTIRPHALGRFEDLLEAVAHSPAMLVYLDNAESVGPNSPAAERFRQAAFRRRGKQRPDPPGINENYGRELMELHTVGVNGGYTQADVIQAARVLTGWTVDRPGFDGNFVFNPNRHQPGTKKVMGVKIKQGGQKEGEELLHLLATRPATAQFLSRKLAVRFVSDNPPQALVDRMARTYVNTGGDISAVLTTLFHSPEFWSASDVTAKVKTPMEFVVSAVRASNANVVNPMPLANTLRQMGMPIYGCVTPNGYSWDSSDWVNTGALVDRMNFALMLASNRLPGITIRWTPPTATADASNTLPTPETEEARLERLLLPGGVSVSTRSAALEQFRKQSAQESATMQPVSQARRFNRRPAPNATERQDQLLAGLLIGSPEFQHR